MDLKNIKAPSLKKLDKKLLARIFLVLAIIAISFIAIIIVKIIIGNRISYEKIEEKMLTSAKEYFTDNESGIKKFKKISEGEIEVSIDTLVEEGYLTDLKKISPNKEVECKGKVTAKSNNGYTLYTPFLECGNEYKTKYLTDIVTASVVTSGDGLYIMDNEYVFRGEKVNNYVQFADKTWLILRVEENGNLRLLETTNREKIVWDDRYNSEVNRNLGKNDFHLSRIKDSLQELYENSDEFTDTDKAYIVPTSLCIGKRNEDEATNDGSIECSEVVENWLIGLIQLNEFALASLDTQCKVPTDRNCENYNYLMLLKTSYWSITTSNNRSDKVYKFNSEPFITSASSEAGIRATIELDKNAVYASGDGSKEKPYVIK